MQKTWDEHQVEIRRIGMDANALLRQADDLDRTLASLPKTSQNKAARGALVEQRESLRRQRHTLLARQREIVEQRQREQRERLLGDETTLTGSLREVARRVGTLEHLYFLLCEHTDDGPESDFDWRIPVRKARKEIGLSPDEGES